MLCNLPDEVLDHIFSFLPSSDQILTIPRVCRRLKSLVAAKRYWRTRFVQMCGGQPVMEHSVLDLWMELDCLRLWQEACMQRELALVAATKSATEGSMVLQGTFGEVDCVHILRSEMHGISRVVAGGARDANVYVWRKRPPSGSREVVEGVGFRRMREFTMATLTGHRGWVWALASERDYRPQLLCSGAWDHNIKIWDVSVGECVATIERQHKAAILSLCIPERDCLVSACFDKKVRVMDLRQPAAVQAEHSLHKRSVLSIAAAGDYVYSGSEDSTVCVWDRRNSNMLQRLQLPGIVPTVHLRYNILSLATSSKVTVEEEVTHRHEVYLYRCPTGNLEEMGHFVSGHSQPVTSVLHCHGMLATASKDGCVQLYTPGTPPTPWTVLHRHHGAITDLDFYMNALAVAKGRGVALWAL